MAAGLVMNANDPDVPTTLLVRGPSLDLPALLGWMGVSPAVHQGEALAGGTLAADAELQGAGVSTQRFLASASGHVGLALTDGELGGAAAAALMRLALQGLPVPAIPDVGDSVPVRCVALRIDATRGKATIPALLLDTSPFRLAGQGSLDLAQQTMAIALRPAVWLRSGGAEWRAQIDGPWAAPHIRFGKPVSDGLDFMDMLPHAPSVTHDCSAQLAIVHGSASRDGP
jgi:AsmA protein